MVNAPPTIVLEHETLRVEVIPGHGAEICFLGHPGGDNVLATWELPEATPGRAAALPSSERAWLAGYRGGWQETFPNAGDACEVDGIALPFHGELSNGPWELHTHTPTTAVLSARSRLSLRLERRMRLVADRATLLLEETVTNETGRTRSFVWGHHPAFEALPGMCVDVAPGAAAYEASTTGPEARAESGDAAWSCVPPMGVSRTTLHFLPDRADGWAALRHADSGRGVAIAWDPTTFPHAWLWQQIEGPAWPWPVEARIVAVEPHRAWPRDGLAAAVARGHACRLGPGEVRTTWLTVSLFAATQRGVVGVGRDGAVTETEPIR